MNGVSALKKETPESSLTPSASEDTVRGTRKRVSLDTESIGTLILDFSPQNCEK